LKTSDRHLTKGFTLIELILVIMLLGVLATVAVPKLIDVQREARVTVINNIAGTLKSTSDLVHYRALIAGETSPNMTNFYINGRQVRLFYGYVSPGTINQVLDIGYQQSTLGIIIISGTYTIWHKGAPNPALCQARYKLGELGNPPIIDTDTAGC